jgi:hypothetical protein
MLCLSTNNTRTRNLFRLYINGGQHQEQDIDERNEGEEDTNSSASVNIYRLQIQKRKKEYLANGKLRGTLCWTALVRTKQLSYCRFCQLLKNGVVTRSTRQMLGFMQRARNMLV